MYSRDVSIHCSSVQVQPVFKQATGVEEDATSRLQSLEHSPFAQAVIREGWNAASAIVAGVVCCVNWQSDTAEVHRATTWLNAPVTSPDSWKCASVKLTAPRPTDTRRFGVPSSLHPPELRLPDLQGGTWELNLFETLRVSVADVGKRLLALHKPTATVQPAVVTAFSSASDENDAYGLQLLFDNGDVRW